MIRLLILENNQNERERLVSYFSSKDAFSVLAASTLLEAKDLFEDQWVDMVLIGMSFPDESGFSAISYFRRRQSMGIVILEHRHSIEDCIMAFELGADEIFDRSINLLYLESYLKRLGQRINQEGVMNALAGDTGAYLWTLLEDDWCLKAPNHQMVKLTATEFTLLKLLLNAPSNTPVSRGEIATALGREKCSGYEQTINVLVSRLRKKVAVHTQMPLNIKAYRGEGYLLVSSIVLA